jgi:hypothetical protein
MTVSEAVAPQVTDHVEYLAHHMLLLAIPAFLPAIAVVGVILYVALRDRRNGDAPGANQQIDAADKKRD